MRKKIAMAGGIFCVVMLFLIGAVIMGRQQKTMQESEVKSEKETGDNIQYRLIGYDTLEISGTGVLNGIDEKYGEVTGFRKEEQEKEYYIRKVIIKDGITKVLPNSSTVYFTYLEEIVFPDTVVEIGDGAFSGRRSLTKITFGNGLKRIGNYAFYECEELEQVAFPDSLLEIGEHAFEDCYNLREIAFGKNVDRIGVQAFSYNNNLQEVNLPDSVRRIESHAFSDCFRLKKLVVPANLRSWEPTIVKECPSLQTIENHSKLSCEIPWYKKDVTWKVGKDKVTKIPPQQTAHKEGKRIPIHYDLNGGVATEELPRFYEYGKEFVLPDSGVKREGYVFMGWSAYLEGAVTALEPDRKKAELKADWYKYEVTSPKKGTIKVYIDHRKTGTLYMDHAVRYRKYGSDEYWNIAFFQDEGRQETLQIKDVEPGAEYEVELSGVIDGDLDYEVWRGNRRVLVKR